MQISAKTWAWTCILQSSFEITFAKILWRKQTPQCHIILEMFKTKKDLIIPFILIVLREVCTFTSSHKKGLTKPLTSRLTYKVFLADQRNTDLDKWNGYQCVCHTHIWMKTYQYKLLCWLYSALILKLSKKVGFFLISSLVLTEAWNSCTYFTHSIICIPKYNPAFK